MSACVGSGMCCKKAPCAFGESISSTDHGCRFLEVHSVVQDVEIYRCGKYSEIAGQPFADINPAFGAGCCQSLFNDNRARILSLIRSGATPPPFRAGTGS